MIDLCRAMAFGRRVVAGTVMGRDVRSGPELGTDGRNSGSRGLSRDEGVVICLSASPVLLAVYVSPWITRMYMLGESLFVVV